MSKIHKIPFTEPVKRKKAGIFLIFFGEIWDLILSPYSSLSLAAAGSHRLKTINENPNHISIKSKPDIKSKSRSSRA